MSIAQTSANPPADNPTEYSAAKPDRPTLILVAHGARDPHWAAPVQRIAAAVRAQAPQQSVRAAFLGMLAPSLEDCIGEALGEGERDFLIVPVFIAEGGHLKRDLPERLLALRARYPQASFRQERAVGEAEAVVQAMATHALAQVPGAD